MLKIKDNVNLEELKRFEFKPRYDSDTGEILYYYKDYFTHRYHTASGYKYSHYEIRVNNTEIKINSNGQWFKKKAIKRLFIYDKPPIYTDGFGYFVDLLFDLIQAGIVEKVEE